MFKTLKGFLRNEHTPMPKALWRIGKWIFIFDYWGGCNIEAPFPS
jgi:hypothetical protein